MLPSTPPLPIVVQLGFSGSRMLVDPQEHPKINVAAFDEAVEDFLRSRLATLPEELQLGSHHFLCGISQVAIGADTLFTRACEALSIPQRIFLPQHSDEYLNAGGDLNPDFSNAEKAIAHAMLELPHIIEHRTVSDSANRSERFQDAQLETARASDLLVCLVRADASGKAGGALDLVEIARKRGIPLLVIKVSVTGTKPSFEENWHHRDRFTPPSLPCELDRLRLSTPPHAAPNLPAYVAALKSFGSLLADGKRNLFKRAAALIIGAHLLATICAVSAVIGVFPYTAVPIILWIEVVFLCSGFLIHHHLHHSHACQIWAVSRVIAEIARSVQSIGNHHLHLSYIFQLPFPNSLTPLLRTLNVLHLISTSPPTPHNWQQHRDEYLRKRLSDPKAGQIGYNRITRAKAARQLGLARRTFLTCSFLAVAATLYKIAGGPQQVTGFLAIVLPVLAVGALSLAAAFDLEARLHISEEMLVDLEDLEKWIAGATSEREFTRLLLETEARLLGETATWYSRRSFTGVA